MVLEPQRQVKVDDVISLQVQIQGTKSSQDQDY